MSRRTRPLRRVRGAERDRVRAGFPPLSILLLEDGDRPPPWVGRAAARLGCRPSQLRRCLLGLPVSARAAKKSLAASARRGG